MKNTDLIKLNSALLDLEGIVYLPKNPNYFDKDVKEKFIERIFKEYGIVIENINDFYKKQLDLEMLEDSLKEWLGLIKDGERVNWNNVMFNDFQYLGIVAEENPEIREKIFVIQILHYIMRYGFGITDYNPFLNLNLIEQYKDKINWDKYFSEEKIKEVAKNVKKIKLVFNKEIVFEKVNEILLYSKVNISDKNKQLIDLVYKVFGEDYLDSIDISQIKIGEKRTFIIEKFELNNNIEWLINAKIGLNEKLALYFGLENLNQTKPPKNYEIKTKALNNREDVLKILNSVPQEQLEFLMRKYRSFFRILLATLRIKLIDKENYLKVFEANYKFFNNFSALYSVYKEILKGNKRVIEKNNNLLTRDFFYFVSQNKDNLSLYKNIIMNNLEGIDTKILVSLIFAFNVRKDYENLDKTFHRIYLSRYGIVKNKTREEIKNITKENWKFIIKNTEDLYKGIKFEIQKRIDKISDRILEIFEINDINNVKLEIDERWKYIKFPMTIRENKNNVIFERGTAFPINLDGGNILRAGIYWKGEIDLDLHTNLIFDDYSIDKIYWSNYARKINENITFSGDITTAPNGAAEFFDIRMDRKPMRYIVFNVHKYSGELAEAIFGIMVDNFMIPHKFQKEESLNYFKPNKLQYKIDLEFDKLDDKTVAMIDLENKLLIPLNIEGEWLKAFSRDEIKNNVKMVEYDMKYKLSVFEFLKNIANVINYNNREKDDLEVKRFDFSLEKIKQINNLLMTV